MFTDETEKSGDNQILLGHSENLLAVRIVSAGTVEKIKIMFGMFSDLGEIRGIIIEEKSKNSQKFFL